LFGRIDSILPVISNTSDDEDASVWYDSWGDEFVINHDAFGSAYTLVEEAGVNEDEQDSEEPLSTLKTQENVIPPAKATTLDRIEEDSIIPSAKEADKQSKKMHTHHVSCSTTTEALVKFNAAIVKTSYKV
jgi:hypothetical protein